jgi:hypothetical protein
MLLILTYFSGGNPEWAVLGDSHGVELYYALAEHLKKSNTSLKQYKHLGCPPALSYERFNCQSDISNSLQAITNDAEIKNVVLAFRHSLHLFGENAHDYPGTPKDINSKFILPDEKATDEQKIEAYVNDMTVIINRLRAKGKHIYMITPIPELPAHVEKALSPVHIFTSQTFMPVDRATSKEYYEKHNAVALGMINELTEQKLIEPINSYEIFCDSTGCPASIKNQLLYIDDDHLGVAGARLYIKRWASQQAELSKQ